MIKEVDPGLNTSNASSSVQNPGVQISTILGVSLAAIAISALVFAEVKYGALSTALNLALSHPIISATILTVALVALGIAFYMHKQKEPSASTSSSDSVAFQEEDSASSSYEDSVEKKPPLSKSDRIDTSQRDLSKIVHLPIATDRNGVMASSITSDMAEVDRIITSNPNVVPIYLPIGDKPVDSKQDSSKAVSSSQIMPSAKAKAKSPISTFNQEKWEEIFSKDALEKAGLSFEGTEEVSNETQAEMLKKVHLSQVENKAGATFLTIPAGMTISKFIDLVFSLEIEKLPDFEFELIDSIENELHKQPPTEKPYTILITNHVLDGSRLQKIDDHQTFLEERGWQVPRALEVIILVILHYLITSNRERPTHLLSAQSKVSDGESLRQRDWSEMRFGFYPYGIKDFIALIPKELRVYSSCKETFPATVGLIPEERLIGKKQHVIVGSFDVEKHELLIRSENGFDRWFSRCNTGAIGCLPVSQVPLVLSQ